MRPINITVGGQWELSKYSTAGGTVTRSAAADGWKSFDHLVGDTLDLRTHPLSPGQRAMSKIEEQLLTY
jgi:hypothetical protein